MNAYLSGSELVQHSCIFSRPSASIPLGAVTVSYTSFFFLGGGELYSISLVFKSL